MSDSPTSTRLRRLSASLAFCLVALLALGLASAVLKPARRGNAGGSTWHSYLALERDSLDVIFFGTSHVFSNVDPASLWRSRGIPSFVMAGPGQELQMTDYYVREALRTQHPKVVVLEMAGSAYDGKRADRAFQRINVAFMPWSRNRVEAAMLTVPPGDRLDVMLDFWPLPGRPEMLSKRDFDLCGKDRGYEYLKGFLPNFKGRKVSSATAAQTAAERWEADSEVAHNMPALRRIAATCRQAGAGLVLLLTPTSPPGGYGYHLRRAATLLRSDFPEVRTLDLDAPGAVPGLSYDTDFRDVGHLNYIGAEKVAPVLAAFLAGTYGLPDRRGEAAYRSWASDAARRDAYIRRRLPKDKRSDVGLPRGGQGSGGGK